MLKIYRAPSLFSSFSFRNLQTETFPSVCPDHMTNDMSKMLPISPRHTICVVIHQRAHPQTTESSVKFYQPWILIVYSRRMLGMWEAMLCCFFSFLNYTTFCQENSQDQRRHTINSTNVLLFFLFVMVIMVSAHVRALRAPHVWRRPFWNVSFTAPLNVNPINVLQKLWVVWFSFFLAF